MRHSLTSLLVLSLSIAACGDDSSTPVKLDATVPTLDGALPDASLPTSSDAGGDAGITVTPPTSSDCYPLPKTYLELINACTDAEKVDKAPVLPLLMTDGGLPPLP
jgi:hypothetical protein